MSFLWPPNGSFAYATSSSSINIFDTLEVDYSSTWSALNFTLFCQIGDVSTDYGVWQAPGNPMAASGTYRLDSIYTAGFDIVKFPTYCAFRMTQYGNSEVYNAGQFFEVISDPGASTTYHSTATPTASSASSSTHSPENTASSTNTPQTTGSAALGATSSNSLPSSAAGSASDSSSRSISTSIRTTAVSSPSASPTTTINPIAQQAILSTGAKAGIGIGIVLVVSVILALCFFIFRLRRKVSRSRSTGNIDLKTGVPVYQNLEDQKMAYVYNVQELGQTSRVELPSQQRTIGPPELE